MSGPGGVIVTGGTGGLGRAVVRRLLERGTRVAVPYRSEKDWQALRASVPGATALHGEGVSDLADPDAARAFVGAAVGRLGSLDGVAAIAGAWAGGTPFEAAPPEEWERLMRTNLSTVSAICRASLPHLLKQGGSVVTIGSQAAETAGAGAAAYAVAKVSVHALTRVLALENRDRGVRFNCVAPGTIDTPANRRAMPNADVSRWTSPEAIARVIVFLLSPESAAVTGALIPVDGRA